MLLILFPRLLHHWRGVGGRDDKQKKYDCFRDYNEESWMHPVSVRNEIMTINNENLMLKLWQVIGHFLIDFKIDCKCNLSVYQAKKWLITTRVLGEYRILLFNNNRGVHMIVV